LSRGEDLNELLRESVQLKILEVNRQRRRAVGSVRAVLRDLKKDQKKNSGPTWKVGKVTRER
jgi:4-hydroxy-3-methylbut-2-enyl diphosphate reductase